MDSNSSFNQFTNGSKYNEPNYLLLLFIVNHEKNREDLRKWFEVFTEDRMLPFDLICEVADKNGFFFDSVFRKFYDKEDLALV